MEGLAISDWRISQAVGAYLENSWCFVEEKVRNIQRLSL